MASMFSRLGKWWQLWVTLAVMWTLAVISYGWMNLPRAQQLPHHPQVLSKLSHEAASILFGRDAQAEPVRGALVWSQSPMIVRMSNGTRLKFPAPTTHEQAALVASEYHQLLDVEADEQKGPYLLAMLAIWLAPYLLLVAGLTLSLFEWRIILHYVRQRTEEIAGARDNYSSRSKLSDAWQYNRRGFFN